MAVTGKKPSEFSAATISALRSILKTKSVYTVLLSQAGTDAPSAIVLEDTVTNIVLSRSAQGESTLTKVGAFPVDKTTPKIADHVDEYDTLIRAERISDDVMKVTTWATGTWTKNNDGTITGTPSDDLLTKQYINIEIYS